MPFPDAGQRECAIAQRPGECSEEWSFGVGEIVLFRADLQITENGLVFVRNNAHLVRKLAHIHLESRKIEIKTEEKMQQFYYKLSIFNKITEGVEI